MSRVSVGAIAIIWCDTTKECQVHKTIKDPCSPRSIIKVRVRITMHVIQVEVGMNRNSIQDQSMIYSSSPMAVDGSGRSRDMHAFDQHRHQHQHDQLISSMVHRRNRVSNMANPNKMYTQDGGGSGSQYGEYTLPTRLRRLIRKWKQHGWWRRRERDQSYMQERTLPTSTHTISLCCNFFISSSSNVWASMSLLLFEYT